MKNSSKSISEELVLLYKQSSDISSLPVEKKKSLLWGIALGLLGPFGWLYSGSWKETIPASLLTLFIVSISLLKPFLFFLLPILLPISAVVGGVYTWSYNQNGKRHSLLLDSKSEIKGV